MKERLIQIGAMLAGAAIIGTAVAVHPVTARDLQGILRAPLTLCSLSTACVGGKNTAGGPGAEGLNTGSGLGVYGVAHKNDGVNGTTYNPSNTLGGRSGVYGVDLSTDGGNGNVGVAGGSTNGIGMEAVSSSGAGIVARSTRDNGVDASSMSGEGLNAFSASNAAIEAAEGAGSEASAIAAVGGTHADANGYILTTYQSNITPAFWVTNDSNAHVNGLLYTHGSCSTGCARGESVVSYAAQSSAPTLEDVGESRLVGGVARIAIDPVLARAIDRGAPYVVFVTPEGSSRGLYVTDKTSAGFEVAENEGGRSSIAFSYRIVAKPYGVSASRLPVVAMPQPPHAVGAPKSLRLPH